ncbi:MAG: tetratricopeptide repeat protein [Magnetococcales bacterium]|nr:tetratricopeptide repeat protein [Magnetococcales bacterium]
MEKTTQLTAQEAFKLAVDHFNDQRFAEADKLCCAIILSIPNHVDAINLLGIIAQKHNQHQLAAERFSQAINLNNSVALFYYNLATALYPLGKRQEAIEALHAAIKIDGGDKKIHDYLKTILDDVNGNLASDVNGEKAKDLFDKGVALQQNGRLQEAVKAYQDCLLLHPDHIGVLSNMAVALQKQGKLDEALTVCQKAISLRPDFASAHFNLAVILQEQGKLQEAKSSLKTVISIEPDNSRGYYNLGVVYGDLKDIDQAIAYYKKTIELQPGFASAHFNIGVLFQQKGRWQEAINSYRKAIAIDPDRAEIHYNLGIALQAHGKPAKAVESYQTAIAIKPDYPEAYSNLGHAKQELGSLDAAVKDLKKAISLNPDYLEAHYNLGVTYQEQEKFSQAIASFNKTLAIKPDYVDAHYNIGCVLQEEGKYSQAAVSYQSAIDLKPDYVTANDKLIFCTDLYTDAKTDIFKTEREKWNIRHAQPLQSLWSPCTNSPDPSRQLRVGYVGADFLHHSAAHIFGPMLLNHNPDNFKVFCYAGNDEEDELTAQFKEKATGWFRTANVDDDQLAAKIREDEIDILVDLAGHTKGNRLLVFARKPAPIQITAWGYPHGTNMAAMDYLFADRFFIPQNERHKYSEEIIDLPCVIHLKPDAGFIPVVDPPAIQNGYVTFGAFNRLEKNNEEVYELWAEILNKLPTAKLLIKTVKLDSKERVTEIIAFFQTKGVGKDRLQLMGRTSREDHIKAHQLIDIMLDPFPNNSGMTSLESLRMGVPVLSCENLIRCPASSSMLHILGLDQWRTKDKQEYVAKAVKFASDIVMLKQLRWQLPDRFEKSYLGDSQLYVKKVEAIYRQLWQKWCE